MKSSCVYLKIIECILNETEKSDNTFIIRNQKADSKIHVCILNRHVSVLKK